MGRFALAEFPTIKERYIDTGKVRWVIRHLPSTTVHDRAEPAARAAECAANEYPEAFFDYRDLVLADQNNLTEEDLLRHASTLGLDQDAFEACLLGQSTASRVQRDVESAASLGADTIPTFYVGNQKISGFHTADQLADMIDSHLAGG